ncbi:MAG: DUF6484 domain-containing protein [Kangiellaceae bacterium]|nr:DUF6484 domain-containing protein [Kangiellaceae bacterium]
MDIKETELELASSTVENHSIAPGEIIIGELVGFDGDGKPLVNYSGTRENETVALSTVPVTQKHKSRQVALLFANGDLSQPVIMGLIHSPLLDILDNIEFVEASQENEQSSENSEVDPFERIDSDEQPQDTKVKHLENTAYVDGERVVIEGKEEIELKCGEASIRLTKSGKILIRGKYLLNRSSGVNRIMGGSVQVN